MSRELTLAMKLYTDASRMMAGLLRGEQGVRKFASTAKREFDSVKNAVMSVEGKLAGLGVTIGVTASIMQSAKLDKSLTQIGQTAGASKADVANLRKELFGMAQETGRDVDDLKDGFNNAVQAGLNFKEALPVTAAVNKAMAVTSASADNLTSSLTVASTAYNFDLAKPNQALYILDQMTAAGRLGNAELENLSNIFARVGPNAASAGMGFEKTLGFIEGLSQIERQPERLATLADSTLRLFNNLKYMKDAQKATGVKFFNKDGSRRDALEVIAEIKQQYDKLDTDAKRAIFIQKAFGEADLDTIKGMRILLSGQMLNTIKGYTAQIKDASGTLQKDLPDAIDNAVDQVGRLKAALRTAADDFSKPINESISGAIKWAMAKKEDGGLGMDGKDMLMAGGGGALATILAAKFGGKALGALAGKVSGLGSGVATGKALESAVGVTPVYVVNMPEGGMGVGADMVSLGKKGVLGRMAGMGATLGRGALAAGAGLFGSAAALPVAAVGAAGILGAGVGSAINRNFIDGTALGDQIGRSIALAMSPFSQEARQAIQNERMGKKAELAGKLEVTLHDNRAPSVSMKTNQPGLKVNLNNGRYMATQ